MEKNVYEVHFLSYSNFSCDLLLSTTVKIAISLIPEELKQFTTIFLTTDDTLQSKFGKKFDCCLHLFDQTSKNGTTYLDGHCFVTLVINIPLFFGSNVQIIPFLNDKFSAYKFQSPQTTKHVISDQISRELILETFVKHLESNKIYSTVKDAVKAYLGIDSAA